MPKTLHSKVGDALTSFLERGPKAVVFNVHGHAMQSKFWPDMIVWHKAWSGGIEIKINKDSMSRGQWQRSLKLIEQGFPVFVLHTKTLRGEWRLCSVTTTWKKHDLVGIFKGEKELWTWLSTRYASSGIYDRFRNG